MSISTLTSAERWKNHGLIGEVQQKFEKQINGNSAFTMNDNLQIEYEGTQATTQKAKETLKKLSGLYAVLNEIQGLNSVATADMLTEDIYIKCKKDYGISKKELQRLISDAQNGLVPQLQYKSAYGGHELERGKHYFAVEAAKERVYAEGDNGEQMKNKVTIHQNMEGEFDGIWKTEAEMDASSFINKIRSEKNEARKKGIAFIEEKVTRLREEQRVRPFQKVTLSQADIVQCKKKYDLSKKEVEKIAIEIQSKTGVAALENNTEQDETTETAEVNAGEVHAAEVNAEEVNAAEVNAAEVHAAEVNAQEVNTEEEMVQQDIEHFDLERFLERQETKGYTWMNTICQFMLDRIVYDTSPVEVLLQYGKIGKTIQKQYELTNKYLWARFKKADQKREELELLVAGTVPQDMKDEYEHKKNKLGSIRWQEQLFESAKKELLNGNLLSGMTYTQFYDMYQYKKSFDLLSIEREKLSKMQALFKKRSQLYKEKLRKNRGIAIPAMEADVSKAQKRVQELENSIARLSGIAEERKIAFKKHEGYGDFSLEQINTFYLRDGTEKVRRVAEKAESVVLTQREHMQLMENYNTAVANRMNAVKKEYNYPEDNYPEDQKDQKEAAFKKAREEAEAAFKKAREEAEAAKSRVLRNQDDYHQAVYLLAGERDNSTNKYSEYTSQTGDYQPLLRSITRAGRLYMEKSRRKNQKEAFTPR